MKRALRYTLRSMGTVAVGVIGWHIAFALCWVGIFLGWVLGALLGYWPAPWDH